MKDYTQTERNRDTQACRNLWAAVLNNAMDLVRNHSNEQSRKFIQNQAGTFQWICEQLDLDPNATSQAMLAAITK